MSSSRSGAELFFIFTAVIAVLFTASLSYAQEFQSTNFKTLDPVIYPAGYSTSTSYQLHSTVSQISISTSTSATSFKINSGFLYFPFVSKPTPSAAAGDSQVTLTWTAASGFLGWSISGYEIGRATVSGGPYTYSSVGNVLTSTQSGLSNGTAYYFVIVVDDAYSNRIATSTQVSATPAAGAASLSTPGGGPIPGVVKPSILPPIIILPPVTTESPETCDGVVADINCDGRVNIIDFSIIYHWFDKKNVPKRVDLNSDQKVDIFDFSIMAFYWTD